MQVTAVSDGIFTAISRKMEVCSAYAWCWVSNSAQDLLIQPTFWHLSIKLQVEEILFSLQCYYSHSSALKTEH